MNTKTTHHAAAIKTLLWAALIGVLIQAGLILILPATKHSPEAENVGLHLFNFLTF
jgi:hypothetical protein